MEAVSGGAYHVARRGFRWLTMRVACLVSEHGDVPSVWTAGGCTDHADVYGRRGEAVEGEFRDLLCPSLRFRAQRLASDQFVRRYQSVETRLRHTARMQEEYARLG